jgi:hypothetical protein
MGDSLFDDEPVKRTLGIRDKKLLYRNANGKCQNPKCNKKIEFDEMQVGHKTAASRGGRATLKNCVCLCWRCNNNQGTDSWPTFLKKEGIQDSSVNTKRILKTLSIPKLKFLAQKKYIKVKGSHDEYDDYSAPTKTQYINKLAKVVSEKDIESALKEMPKVKKRKHRSSDDDW